MPTTPQELRHAAVGCSDAAIRPAVEAGLRECPLPDVPADPGFPALVAYWLLDSWEWCPPPLPETTIAAIYRHLVASANW
jgi:hypothetical protein